MSGEGLSHDRDALVERHRPTAVDSVFEVRDVDRGAIVLRSEASPAGAGSVRNVDSLMANDKIP